MAFDITSYVLGKKSAGGGGSSDFSTAEVSIVGGNGIQFKIPCVIDNEDGPSSAPSYIPSADNETVTAILYKGHCFVSLVGIQGTISVTGDIENLMGPMYLISGDCTITIS